jgi:hypothetical protein
MNKSLKLFAVAILSVGLITACDKKEEGAGGSSVTLLPLVLPSVQATAPTTTAVLNILSTPATKEEALLDFFSGTFSGISGTSATGFLNASIGDLDSRISTLNGQFSSDPTCLTSTPYDWTISTGAPANYSITLKLNCLSMFTQTNGDQSGAGSGMAWGQDDNYYYIALLLVQQSLVDKFGYFATYNKTTKAVDLLFIEYSQTYSRATVYRVQSNPATSSFQVAMAGSGFSAGPMFPALGCNLRMISDGTQLLVAGKAGETSSADGSCQTNSSYLFNSNVCFDATNVTSTTAACTTLTTNSFSSEFAEIDGTTIHVSKTNINTNLTFSGLTGNVANAQ